jgi:acyl-CoA reductase-like NAD-dependent aldehyde dehydrogenase
MASKTSESKLEASMVRVRGGQLARHESEQSPASDDGARLRVNKAYKMYVGGAFIRSESGRTFQVQGGPERNGADPETVNIPRASRKDLRDAVVAARGQQDKWAQRTAYNRGQILYRLAEVMESRRAELVESLQRGGLAFDMAEAEVNEAVDRTVYYAGMCDKVSALFASHNPVAGPHFGFSLPEATGLACVIAPQEPVLLGLVATCLPLICSGNVVIALASERDPRTAVVFAECLATSDMPGGVFNILTGSAADVGPIMARHRDVGVLDVTTTDQALRKALEELASESVKRVRTRVEPERDFWLRAYGPTWVEAGIETKTVWHPMGI